PTSPTENNDQKSEEINDSLTAAQKIISQAERTLGLETGNLKNLPEWLKELKAPESNLEILIAWAKEYNTEALTTDNRDKIIEGLTKEKEEVQQEKEKIAAELTNANQKLKKLQEDYDEAKNELQELEKVANDYYNYAKKETKNKENELETANGDKDNAEKNVEEKNKIEELSNKITELETENNKKTLAIAKLFTQENLDQIKEERDQRPNITLEQYQELLNNQKPTDLPNRIPDLEKRPTQEDYNKVAAERDRRPNISQAEYDKVITERDEYSKRPTQEVLEKAVNDKANEYKDFIDPANFAEVARQKGYKSKDEVDAEVAKEIKKYQNYIHPDNLEAEAKKADTAVNNEKAKYAGLVDPTNYRANWIDPTKLEEEAKKKGMATKTDYDNLVAQKAAAETAKTTAEAERDARPDMTIAAYDAEKLAAQNALRDMTNERDARPDIPVAD
ncbi:10391_t:CDS:2, partial [Cetraspora pellucida]